MTQLCVNNWFLNVFQKLAKNLQCRHSSLPVDHPHLKTTNRSFQYASPCLVNQHPTSFCQPHGLILKPRSDRTHRRASTRPIKLMLKIGSIHTERVDARQLICINERCQIKLYIGYWTSNNNKWPKCSYRYQTQSPDNTCANDVTENDVI